MSLSEKPAQTVALEKEQAIPEKAAEETKLLLEPFPHPLPESKPAPPPTLSTEQTTKYDELLATVRTWTEVPSKAVAGASKDPINDHDRIWLTRECLLRYLRATKWSVPHAHKRLLATMTWRREYGLLGFTHDYISPENETGKQCIIGYDNEARPCLYLDPSKQNTPRGDRQLHHLFYNVERVIELMTPGQESLTLILNFLNTRMGQGATIGQGKDVMQVLQNHYPERLGRALITELPWYIGAFFKLIRPFIDPETQNKLIFNQPVHKFVPPEQLLSVFGGKVEFEYKHSVYWPSLNNLCTMRREDYFGRWVKAGKQIGEHEVYLRGGEAKCLNGMFSGLDFTEGFSQGEKSWQGKN